MKQLAKYFSSASGRRLSLGLATLCLTLLAACGGTSEEDFAVLPDEKLQALCGSKAADDQKRAAMNCSRSIETAVIFITDEWIQDTGNGTDSTAYPQMLVGKTAVPLKNETGQRVFFCGLGARGAVLPDGRPYANCTEPRNGNVRGIYPIDVPRVALLPKLASVSPDSVPSRNVADGLVTDMPYARFDVGRNGSYVETPSGIYYWTNRDRHILRVTTDDFATNEVIKVNPEYVGEPGEYRHFRLIEVYSRRSASVR